MCKKNADIFLSKKTLFFCQFRQEYGWHHWTGGGGAFWQCIILSVKNLCALYLYTSQKVGLYTQFISVSSRVFHVGQLVYMLFFATLTFHVEFHSLPQKVRVPCQFDGLPPKVRVQRQFAVNLPQAHWEQYMPLRKSTLILFALVT